MENSFFEYRDKTGVDSESELDSIDDSFVENPPFSTKKKTNHTVYIPESEESGTDGETQNGLDDECNSSNSLLKSKIDDTHIILSSDNDESPKGSFKNRLKISHKEFIVHSSNDEDQQLSPELIPRRPPLTPQLMKNVETKSNMNKRRMLFDSDLDNSLVIEHNRNRKQVCRNETPLKIDKGNNIDSIVDDKIVTGDEANVSINKTDIEEDATIDDSEESEVYDVIDDKSFSRRSSNQNVVETISNDNDLLNDSQNNKTAKITNKLVKKNKIIDSDESSDDEYLSSIKKKSSKARNVLVDSDDESVMKSIKNVNSRRVISSDDSADDDDDDGPDEDQMVMSRATRMSIMGVIPKGNDSDESDFIESDNSHRKSRDGGSTDSLSELPAIGIEAYSTTPGKNTDPVLESSRLTCSPIVSPLRDVTNEVMDLTKIIPNVNDDNRKDAFIGKPIDKLNKFGRNENFIKYDDDVTIIDTKPEIIDLSSEDEDEAKAADLRNEKKSPKPKKKPLDGTMKSFLVPQSYPNQAVVYVKKEVRQTEINKLNGLREDLHNIRHLLDNMDVDTLPDGGAKLVERLTSLEKEVHRQGERVANMVIEPDKPTADDFAKDGFDKGLSWDDIQKASNAVQPRLFGKQAMATHMAERNLILDRLRNLHESLASRPPETELANPPRGVTTKLMQHQLHALAWLRWRETQRPTAGILADDMGLGKTITMIALMVSDKENRIDDDDSDDELPTKSNKSRGGTLVVCPASLMQQWAGEVVKHCAPHYLSVCQHHGPSRATQPHRLASHDLVLTTYNILQRDNEKNGVLMRVRWRRVILDEAHVVRNHKSATSGAVSALHASRRWCLTGTPVQNKDLDLFALLKFLRCTPFDELTMWKKWIDNKSLGGQERLNTIMSCILLRRTKQQLQQRGQLDCLPERSSHQNQVTLTKAEMNVYQKVLVFSKTLFAQFLHQRAEKNADTARVPPSEMDSEYAKMHKKMIALQGAKPVKSHEILVLLLRLRQVCCHCGLIGAMLDEEGAGEVYEDPGGKDLLAELNKLSLEEAGSKTKNNTEEEDHDAPEEGTTVTEAIRSVMSPNNPVFSLDKPSSKIKAVMSCLKENVFSKKGEKAVVVSQWTSVLRLVEHELAQLKVRSVTLSGVVPVPARPALIQQINDPASDVRVLLLSLCAGGVGLNLCGANHLLLLDPHWNPQLEEQAQDRIYRVGQKKPVHIYRFMCLDTVEQTIRKLQEAKLELAANVLTGARNTNASKLSIEDLKMLFNMGQQQ